MVLISALTIMSGSANSLVRPASPLVELVTLTGDTTLEVANAGIINADPSGATFTITLPPCDANDIGTEFTFVVSANAGNNLNVYCDSGDVFIGGVKVDDPGVALVFSSGTNDRFVAGGAAVGSRVTVSMVSSTQWLISGTVSATGAFSTTP